MTENQFYSISYLLWMILAAVSESTYTMIGANIAAFLCLVLMALEYWKEKQNAKSKS